MTVAYDGSGLFGWQRQRPGLPSVQEHIEASLAVVFGRPVNVEGAGRTDAGVHAFAQMAHADLPCRIPVDGLVRALNGQLPPAIAIRDAREVSPEFHARFHAIGKRYAYRYVVDAQRPVLARNYYHWVRRPLDVDAMRAGAAFLCGEHDFSAFATNPGYVRRRGNVRRIDRFRILHRRHGVDFVVQGNGFLYNMVRTIAGTLRDVGVGKHPPEFVARVLASRDRRQASATLDPGGLYLLRVIYPQDLLRPVAESTEAGVVDG